MEKLMYYIWQHRLYSCPEMKTTDGRSFEIIDSGRPNPDSGPDFFNAKIRIGEHVWAGNVEIHLRSSDWLKHRHQNDKAYDSVILHVVGEADCDIFRTDGEAIPQWEMPCSARFRDEYVRFVDGKDPLPCASSLAGLPPLFLSDWKSALSIERLEQKSQRILDWVDQYRGNWEEVCYLTLSRTLGFGANSDAFERLARSLPLLFLQKHADSLFQTEAFLFGQAGLLPPGACPGDEYYGRLCDEYAFLKNKFSLTPVNGDSWKFFRLRPANFPHRRIALLARMIHGGFSLFSRICEQTREKEFRSLFQTYPGGYWEHHYTFGRESTTLPGTLSRAAVDVLLINTVAPLLYSYALRTGNERYADRAMRLLEQLRPEENRIIRCFRQNGIGAANALDSQALLQLHTAYCERRKCLYCRIGYRIFSRPELR